jgi:hypothetical protein
MASNGTNRSAIQYAFARTGFNQHFFSYVVKKPAFERIFTGGSQMVPEGGEGVLPTP